MVAAPDRVREGRGAFARQAWAEAYAHLSEADALAETDHECLAVAAFLTGRDEESARAWERAFLGWVEAGEPDRAARCAFWVGFALFLRGETARGGGWLSRAQRVLDESTADGPARGYLLLPAFMEALIDDPAAAFDHAGRMVELARRHRDPDLLALGLLCSGEAALALGDHGGGMRQLDEAMVSVTAGEVSPIPAGIVYCAVIEACMNAFDLRRAAEWTTALAGWCASQPDLVPYRGQCLVHRSQVLCAHGDWDTAATEAERARERLAQPPHAALGAACYQQGELHRLRGGFAAAEEAYRAAHERGFEPAPGLALLRLAQGRTDVALAAVSRMVDETHGRPGHAAVLAAAVEVCLAAGEHESARSASERLTEHATAVTAPLLGAIADYAAGSVLLDEGEAGAALVVLRRAWRTWCDLDMPYDAARARLLIGTACGALGDRESAALEFEAALATFERLGARPDRDRAATLLCGERSAPPPELTARECEVLRLVASGRTNRAIAAELVISEHTVARHLQNIFLKLDLSSRAAATAYAYEHGLL